MIFEHGCTDLDSHHRVKHFEMANGAILLNYGVWESCMICLGGSDGPAARGAGIDIEGKGNPGVLMDELNPIET